MTPAESSPAALGTDQEARAPQYSMQGDSAWHLSPEILRRESGPSRPSDVYAFGMLAVEGSLRAPGAVRLFFL